LKDLGYVVLEAPDSQMALRLLENRAVSIDLLFSDIVLPGGLTGAEIAGKTEIFRPRMKVLFTTGYARNAIVHQGRLDAGV
jgi:DNA-binding LytR/AlgR family response regulator